MREIIMPNSGKGNSEKDTVDMAHVNARAVKRSTALGSVNQLCLDIDLDSLDEDPIQRSKELYKMLCEKYAEAKRTFEGSNTGRGIARIGGKLWTPHLAASKCITTGHRKSKEIQPYLPGLECDDREGGIGCTQKASTAIVNGRAI